MMALRRKGRRVAMGVVILLGFLFFASSILWLGMRGDQNSDVWFLKFKKALFIN